MSLIPQTAFAHEVYVLTPSQISKDLVVPMNVFSSLLSTTNLMWFGFFGLCAIISLSISFFVSYSKWGVGVTKLIEKYSKFALPVIRVVLGISLLYSAYFHVLFGPELPLSHILGGTLWSTILYIAGVGIIFGLFTRGIAVVLLTLFLLAIGSFHEYMLTYSNYFGELIILLLWGGGLYSFDRMFFKKSSKIYNRKEDMLAIAILRITFALSLLYAALYVKFLHPALSYNVVTEYHLTRFFPFDPLFIVFGAGCIEAVIAFLFLFGLNMRWNIIFFAFWATLSLIYFGESVWPHYILFGICIGLFLYGYDRYTLDKWAVGISKKILHQE